MQVVVVAVVIAVKKQFEKKNHCRISF